MNNANSGFISHFKGKFITLEGPEGSGKSTQAGLLAEYFLSKGKKVVRTREPGGVSISEQLREILLAPKNLIYPQTELFLYAACRAQHTRELIIPALQKNKYVICERYTHASIAYQGYGRKLDINLIKKLNKAATLGISPDVVILLDIDVEKGLNRVKELGNGLDRLELEKIAFHKRVRNGYLKIAKSDNSIKIVNADDLAKFIHKKIVNIINEF